MAHFGKTRVDVVHREIRLAILEGELSPGSRLLSAALCEAYAVSSGVLREVLTRLAGEGLVISESQRGFRVIDISPEDLLHLTESRVLVETELVRQSVALGDLDFEAGLAVSHHRLSRTPMTDPGGHLAPDWLQAHRAFHASLLAGSPNLRLRGIAGSLRDAAEVYQCWSRTVSGDAQRDVAGEHQQLLDAVLERQPERAATLLKAHIERTTQVLLHGREAAGKDSGTLPDHDRKPPNRRQTQ